MSQKSKKQKPQEIPEVLESLGKELGPRSSLKEHLIIAGVLGGIFLVFLGGMFVAFKLGAFTPSGAPPTP